MPLTKTLLVACVLLLSVAPASGHLGYEKLRRKDGQTCCDGTECQKAKWRVLNGQLQAFINNDWHPVPFEAIVGAPAPEGEAYACWWNNQVWCFGFGPMS